MHTDYSFNKAVAQTVKFIDENVCANGGHIGDGIYYIKPQAPVAPAYVKGFGDLRVNELVSVSDPDRWRFNGKWEVFVYGDGGDAPYKVATRPGDAAEVEFNGSGVALLGSWNPDGGCGEVFIDGNRVKDFDSYYVTEAGKYEGNIIF